jgi:CHAT domain-containing protein
MPERSGVVLSLFDDRGKRREGFLSAPDVAARDLPADLAVLSACQGVCVQRYRARIL